MQVCVVYFTVAGNLVDSNSLAAGKYIVQAFGTVSCRLLGEKVIDIDSCLCVLVMIFKVLTAAAHERAGKFHLLFFVHSVVYGQSVVSERIF